MKGNYFTTILIALLATAGSHSADLQWYESDSRSYSSLSTVVIDLQMDKIESILNILTILLEAVQNTIERAPSEDILRLKFDLMQLNSTLKATYFSLGFPRHDPTFDKNTLKALGKLTNASITGPMFEGDAIVITGHSIDRIASESSWISEWGFQWVKNQPTKVIEELKNRTAGRKERLDKIFSGYTMMIHHNLIEYLEALTDKTDFPINYFNTTILTNKLKTLNKTLKGRKLATTSQDFAKFEKTYRKIKGKEYALFFVPVISNARSKRVMLAKTKYYAAIENRIYKVKILSTQPFYRENNITYSDKEISQCKEVKKITYCPSRIKLNKEPSCLQNLKNRNYKNAMKHCKISITELKEPAYHKHINTLHYASPQRSQIQIETTNGTNITKTIQGIGEINLTSFDTIWVNSMRLTKTVREIQTLFKTKIDWEKLIPKKLTKEPVSKSLTIIENLKRIILKENTLTRHSILNNIEATGPINVIIYLMLTLLTCLVLTIRKMRRSSRKKRYERKVIKCTRGREQKGDFDIKFVAI